MRYKYKEIVCDICGKTITTDGEPMANQIKFKWKAKICPAYLFNRKWEHADICPNCARKIADMVKEDEVNESN